MKPVLILISWPNGATTINANHILEIETVSEGKSKIIMTNGTFYNVEQSVHEIRDRIKKSDL